MNKKSFLTQHAEFCTGSDVVVLVGSSAAKTARVVIGDTPDDQIAASQQRILLIPTGGGKRFSIIGWSRVACALFLLQDNTIWNEVRSQKWKNRKS